MMYEYEFMLAGKNKITFKRTAHGVVAVELSKPGHARDGHGWLVVDGLFLDPADVEQLRAVLGAETPCSRVRLADGAMLPVTAEAPKYGAS